MRPYYPAFVLFFSSLAVCYTRGMKTQTLSGSWQFRQTGSTEWLPAHVPGGVHTDLLALGRIPDPFVADNEKKVQWVAESDWEYRHIFRVDRALTGEQHILLVCDGLDTLAEVSLNGKELGKTDNMFRRWSWEAGSSLRAGENELRIVFRSPVKFIKAKQAIKPLLGGGDIPGGPHLRKAPCQWGWDWGPKLPPIGIWKDIRLEGHHQAKFEDVHIRQIHVDSMVAVTAEIKIEQWEAGNLAATLQVTSPDGGVEKITFAPNRSDGNRTSCNLQLEIKNPRLWWPNGFGEQPLYLVKVSLESEEEVLEQRDFRVGLRRLELRQEPDEWGESFTFVVNDVPVFAKGADWIPADSFPTRISDSNMERLIRDAAAAHMNMLRVWGGGFYEEDRFYDLCDRYGLLIWQDFIFACGIYPEDDAFAENVRVEAIENVRRLRHHACLAIWCGNNEMEQGWVDWKWNDPDDPTSQTLKAGYDRMFHHLLPGVVADEDPDRPYWPSSASSGIPFANPNSQQRGDTHYWDVWHGRKPFSAYREQFPRFMSEFGFQALPTYQTIQTYAAPQDQNMTSYIMEHHQRSGSGNGLMISQMTDTFRMPKDFQALVYLSMVLQAEGIRYGVEHWRRHRERVSGTLIWQLNDCWPVASWSSIDYFGRWKALHYAARRFYAPVLMSVEDQGDRMGLCITNDTTSRWKGELRWSLETLEGQRLDQGIEHVSASALQMTCVRVLDFSTQVNDENRRQVIFTAELWQDQELLTRQVANFVPNKHLELRAPQIETTIFARGRQVTIQLKARSLARFVALELDGADVVFSDNFFDMPAGVTAEITCPLPDGWNVKQVKSALRIRSLYDSYQ
jgi:beta-mannosidase